MTPQNKFCPRSVMCSVGRAQRLQGGRGGCPNTACEVASRHGAARERGGWDLDPGGYSYREQPVSNLASQPASFLPSPTELSLRGFLVL